MNRLDKTESVVFLHCRLSLFLKDPFFPDNSMGLGHLLVNGVYLLVIRIIGRVYCL